MSSLWSWLARLVNGDSGAGTPEALSDPEAMPGADEANRPAGSAGQEPAAESTASERASDIADFLFAEGYVSAERVEKARTEADEASGQILADYMVEKGYASAEQIEEARKAQQSTKGDLAAILIDLGLNPRDVYEAKAHELQVPFVDLTVYKPDQSAINVVPEHVAKRHNILPIKKDGTTLYVAMSDLNNITANDDIRLVSRCVVRGVLAVPEHIEDSIIRLYGPNQADASLAKQLTGQPVFDFASDELKTAVAQATAEYIAKHNDRGGFDEFEDPPYEPYVMPPIVLLANIIIQQAIQERVSDIHLDPERREMRVRFRVDGILHEVIPIPKFIQRPLLNRYKVMAEFNLATHRGKPQSGVIGIRFQGRDLSIHLGATPTLYGDKMVLKIADYASVLRGLNKLGFTPEVQSKLEELAEQPSGLLLFAGPHGSGRSTTQYTLLNKLNSNEKSLLTIEPYSSYRLSGILQVDLRQRRGLTYRDVWNTASDVDVLHIDRVKNTETADLAASAAEAGTLVLAAIDSADAVSALSQLMEWGLSVERIGRTVTGVLAQRLVRRLCTHCKEFYEVPAVEMRRFGFRATNPNQTVQLARGAGCEMCRHTGYKGRIGVYELLVMNAEIVETLARRGNNARLDEAARCNGMKGLLEHGLVTVLEGQTTPHEVMRVLGL